jgi:hypothetical protein
MKRPIVLALLAVGIVAGYASGLAHLNAYRDARRATFERHVAEVCLNAAKEAH